MRINQFIFMIVLLLPSLSYGYEIEGKVERVIDGDTLVMEGVTLRLASIDAFEIKQVCYGYDRIFEVNCGGAAKKRLEMFVMGSYTRCFWKKKGKYGRPLATCYTRGHNVNGQMVLSGWAMPYRDDDTYDMEANNSQAVKLGAWGYEFENPWEWRKR